jgi:CBS domain-containing protein
MPGRKYARAMATLGEVMSRDVITIEPFDTIGHAAEKMVAEGVSAIVVSDGGRLIGIVTERDLTRAVAGRVHSSEARVREWMTAEPKVVSESTDPVEAVQIMLDGGFRHLPVVENERAVGIVSIRDLAEWSIRTEQAQTKS